MQRRRWILGWLGLWGLVALGTPPIHDDSYGYRLPSPPDCSLWWCEAPYKVGRHRALPGAASETVWIEAARNEYEPFQLVLYPHQALTNVTVQVEQDWAHATQASVTFAATNVEVRLVEYVPVEYASDAGGVPGWYPDPLLPMPAALTLPPGQQQPFWITVYVPKTQPAGIYAGYLRIDAEGWSEPVRVPVRLRVFDFTLSDVTHTRTLYDVAIPGVWHGPLDDAQRARVWDLYMDNFRRHRVSPQFPQRYAPLRWSWGTGQFAYDFTNYNRALTRYLDEFGFRDFVFMDEPWSIFEQPRYEPLYNSLFTLLMSGIAENLRRKGWMDRALSYWIDEPADSLLPFVRTGMHVHLHAAPDLRRLLTREPLPDLYGLVNAWVPLAVISVFNTTSERWFERIQAGEQVWWYVATYPKWPVPNYFIDHPAITHRIRFWLAERYGLQGDLYWDVNWYLDRQYQPIDPWTQTTVLNELGQPMGNGDGVLVYPPVKTPPSEPVVAGPIDSLRWELIREGLEDREYFWLLRELRRQAALRWGPVHPAVAAAENTRAEALQVASALTNYTLDVRQLLAARRALAETLERLHGPEPFWVEEPVAKVVDPGEAMILRCEALGWPPPAYHWYKDGALVMSSPEGRLRVPVVGIDTPGDYWVVASNVAGAVTSRVARVRGSWSVAPEIVVPPAPQTVRLGNPAVLTVLAVGRPPLEFFWFKDGELVQSDGPVGPTFLRSNTPPEARGLYHVVVSNDLGMVTSAPVRVAVVWDLLREPLLGSNASWHYHLATEELAPDWPLDPERFLGWRTGPAPFGHGSSNAATILAREDGTAPATAAFFTELLVDDPDVPLEGHLVCDDGAAVFVNGQEVFRLNLPTGPLGFDTSPSTLVDGPPLQADFFIAPQLLRPGTNLLAVQLHDYALPVAPLAVWPFDGPQSPWERLGGGLGWTAVGTGIVSGVGRWLGCVSNTAAADSWLELPDEPALRAQGPFTVGGWFAWDFGLVNTAARTGIQKAGEYRLYYTGPLINRYRFQLGDSEVQEQTPGTRAGQWRLVIAWFDGTNANIQMDNGPVYSTPASLPEPTVHPVVALRLDPGAGGFAADDLFFFPRALSAAERTAIYQLGIRRFVTNLLESAREDLWFELRVSRLRGSPPQFLAGPESLLRFEGESAAFELSAVGTAPLRYQWLFNGAPLPGATDAVLFLPQLTAAQSGLYALVASNIAGAVTSPPARLQVVGRPRLEVVPELVPPGFRLDLPQLAVASVLQVSTNLQDWETVWDRPANSPAAQWSVPLSPDRPAAFYRLQLRR